MKILVLGGAGFIGTHIVQLLVFNGHHVRVLDRNAVNLRAHGVENFYTDISDTMALSEALIGIDMVIHLVSTSVPSTSNKDPINDVSGNLINTLKLLEIMRQSDVSRIIYFSSGGTVYGHPNKIPMDELHPTNPICSYGIVKLAIEKYLLMYSELYGFTSTILRPSNPYGPGQRHTGIQGFIGTCINKAINGEKLTIWGDGSVVRDYIYITDVADITMEAVNKPISGVFNVSSGIGYSLNEIIKLVEETTNKRINVEYKEKRNFDLNKMILDNTKAIKTFSWETKVDLTKGLYLTFDELLTSKRYNS